MRDVSYHDRPRSDDRPAADLNSWDNAASDSDQRAFGHLHAAREISARSEVHIIAQNAVVIDCCSCIYDGAVADARARIDNCAWHNRDSESQSCSGRDRCFNTHGVHEREPEFQRAKRSGSPSLVISNGNECVMDPCREETPQFIICTEHRVVQQTTLGSITGSTACDFDARLFLENLDDDLRVTSGTHEHDLRLHARALRKFGHRIGRFP